MRGFLNYSSTNSSIFFMLFCSASAIFAVNARVDERYKEKDHSDCRSRHREPDYSSCDIGILVFCLQRAVPEYRHKSADELFYFDPPRPLSRNDQATYDALIKHNAYPFFVDEFLKLEKHRAKMAWIEEMPSRFKPGYMQV